ncbi:DUF1302 domain-containing protein [Variovorax paradoxus]|uniref:DUF1302 domain-containing protein n=1 Tax=Variovorax paradoxus TaxID=34073 RepID=UPI0029C6CF5E|nr:DUF1302 domain-containing protein [Variovorax paradoxus]
MRKSVRRDNRRLPQLRQVCIAALTAAFGSAQAAEFDTGTELKLRWDNTVKYSAAWRLAKPSPALSGPANPNGDDGDLNFAKGMVSNRVDLLSEFDLSYRDFGFRASATAWFDELYRRGTDNTSPATSNTRPNNAFDPATATLHGKKAELMDAFVFGQTELGDGRLLSFRLGRHALLYGESLFFGNNGIAGTQGPTDVIKALQVPSSQAKEVFMPVNQLSAQLQLNPSVTLGGYYQFEWRRNRTPAVGSFLSAADFLDTGGRRILRGAPLVPGGGPQVLNRTADVEASDSGQFGAQLKWRPDFVDADVGFYFTRSNGKNAITHARPAVIPAVGVVDPSIFNPITGQVGTYSLVFPEGIKTFGASVNTTLGPVNLGAEASVRFNSPLVTAAAPVLPGEAAVTGGRGALFPVGKSAHMQVSAIYVAPRTSVWDSATLMTEIAWNRRLSVKRNPGLIDPNSTRDATAVRVSFEPTYLQVIPGLDISVPISIGYGLSGRSSVVPAFSVYHGGNVSIGINAEYQKLWKFGLSYVQFTGATKPVTVADGRSPSGLVYTFGQPLADRKFIAINIQRSF